MLIWAKVGVGAALGSGHAHLGRGGLVVELDPEALQQLFGLLGQRAVLQALLVEGKQVLVELARAEGVPGVELGGHAQVHEPVGLQRFPEVRGAWAGTRRQTSAIVPARPALPGRLLCGQRVSPLGVTLGKADDARAQMAMALSSSALA
jgi:hypothetical protein